MLKLAYFLRNSPTLRANNSKILRIKNVKSSMYCHYINTNVQLDFQICISVPLMHNQREMLTVLQSSPFTYNKIHVKSYCTIQLFYLCAQILPKIPKKKFIFSKVAGLQTATLLKNKLLHKQFLRALTTEEIRYFVETRVNGCFCYKQKHKRKQATLRDLLKKNG